jgi:hypothetical protein
MRELISQWIGSLGLVKKNALDFIEGEELVGGEWYAIGL